MELMLTSWPMTQIWMSRQVVHTRNRMVMTCHLTLIKIKLLGHMASTHLLHMKSDCKHVRTSARAGANATDLISVMTLSIQLACSSQPKFFLTPLTKGCKLLRKFAATELIGWKYRAILQKPAQTIFPTPIRMPPLLTNNLK